MKNSIVDVLDVLSHEMNGVPEIDLPTGMWDRFVARLDAEPIEAPTTARAPSRKQVLVRGLAFLPTR